jgi:hypothetical protein
MNSYHKLIRTSVLLTALLFWFGCAIPPGSEPATALGEPTVEAEQLLDDIRELSSVEMEGREPGTPGHARAQEYIRARFSEIGLQPLVPGYEHRFAFEPPIPDADFGGVNLVGIIPGTIREDRFIVLTAHYDHLGIRDGEIYHGADDNASGTAALFAVAQYFLQNPPRNSVVIAELHAEERLAGPSLRGARALVADQVVPLDQIVLNVNMDMISRSDRNELYAAGAFHYPFLAEYIVRTAATSAGGQRSTTPLSPPTKAKVRAHTLLGATG